MLYLRARHYVPGMGRFLTKDLWSGDSYNPLSLNQWAYTYSNPITYTDPTGAYPCPWNRMLNCTRDQIVDYHVRKVLISLGFSVPQGKNIQIPGIGDYHTTGTPTRIYLESVGPGLATVGDTGLSLLSGGDVVYDGYNSGLGYNVFTRQEYTRGERIWMGTFSILGISGDCFPGLRFAPDGLSGGAPARKEVLLGFWGMDSTFFKTFAELYRRGKNIVPYDDWAKEGLTSINPKRNFPEALAQTLDSADHINFDITDLNIERAWREGRTFTGNYTSYEFYQIMTNPKWLGKTTFIEWKDGMIKMFTVNSSEVITPMINWK